jgi:hypothetical protein
MDIQDFCYRVKKIEGNLEKVKKSCYKDYEVIKSIFTQVLETDENKNVQKSPETILVSLVQDWRDKSLSLSFEPKEEPQNSELQSLKSSLFHSQSNNYYEDEEIVEGPYESESIQGDPLSDWPYKSIKDYKLLDPDFDPDKHFAQFASCTPHGKNMSISLKHLFNTTSQPN